jgi:hypothetical protein
MHPARWAPSLQYKQIANVQSAVPVGELRRKQTFLCLVLSLGSSLHNKQIADVQPTVSVHEVRTITNLLVPSLLLLGSFITNGLQTVREVRTITNLPVPTTGRHRT